MNVGVTKLAIAFKLKGFDQELLVSGVGTRLRNRYTAYGVLRDKRTGAAKELKCVVEASLGQATPDEFTRGNSMGHSYALNEITHYEIEIDGTEILYWDFWTNEFRSGGVDVNADVNRILRVSGTVQ